MLPSIDTSGVKVWKPPEPAPVKQQYLIEKPKRENEETPKKKQRLNNYSIENSDLKESNDINMKNNKNNNTNNNKKKRGQNTSRMKKNRMKYGITIYCPDIVRGSECKAIKMNKKCKYNHNINEYMSNKVKDLGNKCLWFRYNGSCRFGNDHIDNNNNLVKNFKDKNENKNNESNTMNEIKIDDNNTIKINNDLHSIINNNYKIEACLNDSKKYKIPKIWFKENKKQQFENQFPFTHQILQKYKKYNNIWHPNQFKNNWTNKKINSDLILKTNLNENKNENKLDSLFKIDNIPSDNPYLSEGNLNDSSESGLPNYSYATSLALIYLENKKLDFNNKLYLAPLTTCGNLPFRRICIDYGCNVTCSEMLLSTSFLRNRKSEWSLLKRHKSEKMFGIQIANGYVDNISKTIEIFNKYNLDYDFIDLNCGCPLEEVCNKRAGSRLLEKPYHLRNIVRTMYHNSDNKPITIKIRKGYLHRQPIGLDLLNLLKNDGLSAIGIHGRSRQQRYRRPADWEYIKQFVKNNKNKNIQILGNGDIYNYSEYYNMLNYSKCNSILIGRGALIKPWIFKEIIDRKHFDISSNERFDLLKKYVNYGLEHWGSDQKGIDNIRKFLLEWLSFLHRYIPIGILEKPIKINQTTKRGFDYIGRNYLETLMKSKNVNDWIKLTELLLGKVPNNFIFVPRHKASSYADQLTKNQIINHLGEIVNVNNSINDKIINRINNNNNTILGKRKRND